MPRKTILVLLVAVLLVTPQTVAAISVDPEFQVTVPEPTLEPGTESELTFQLTNDPDDVQDTAWTAENVRVTVESGETPITVKSGTRRIGTMPDSEVKTVSARIEVPANISAGTYRLPIRVQYEYFDPVNRDQRETTTVYAEVRVEDRARFQIRDVTSEVPVGGVGTVAVRMTNVGEETAHDASVTLRSATTDVRFGESGSASRFVDTWAPGETRTLEYDVTVAENAEARSYALEAIVAYEDDQGNSETSRTLPLGVTPQPDPFEVRNVESTLRVNNRGKLTGEVVNTGSMRAQNAVVVFESATETVEPAETEYAVGTLRPDESVPFSFSIEINDSSDPGPRQFSLRVRYRNVDGDRITSGPLDVRANVGKRQPEFAIRDVESTLRVGEKGTFRGTIVNSDGQAVQNAVLVFESSSATVNPVETQYALGNLAVDERAEFTYDVEVTSEAEAGPRQFDLFVRYRDTDGQLRTSDTIEIRARIGQESPEFDVEPVNATVSAGGTEQLRLRVTNNREEPLRDISAKIYTEEPLGTDDDEAFVPELAPGESEVLVFDISAGGAALSKTYPVKLDFRYDDSDGDTIISDTYQIPVQVSEQSRGGLPVPLIAGVVLLVVGVGGFLYYRRQQE